MFYIMIVRLVNSSRYWLEHRWDLRRSMAYFHGWILGCPSTYPTKTTGLVVLDLDVYLSKKLTFVAVSNLRSDIEMLMVPEEAGVKPGNWYRGPGASAEASCNFLNTCGNTFGQPWEQYKVNCRKLQTWHILVSWMWLPDLSGLREISPWTRDEMGNLSAAEIHSHLVRTSRRGEVGGCKRPFFGIGRARQRHSECEWILNERNKYDLEGREWPAVRPRILWILVPVRCRFLFSYSRWLTVHSRAKSCC